jgi:uncharacterized membrane protein YeaQ/YmgE (transglycosylase-associated protein family)
MDFGDLIFLLLLLILSAGLGMLSQRILHLKLGGLFASTFLGLVGAYLGKEIAGWLHLSDFRIGLTLNGHYFPIVWAVVGALLATAVVGAIAKGASKQKKKK